MADWWIDEEPYPGPAVEYPEPVPDLGSGWNISGHISWRPLQKVVLQSPGRYGSEAVQIGFPLVKDGVIIGFVSKVDILMQIGVTSYTYIDSPPPSTRWSDPSSNPINDIRDATKRIRFT